MKKMVCFKFKDNSYEIGNVGIDLDERGEIEYPQCVVLDNKYFSYGHISNKKNVTYVEETSKDKINKDSIIESLEENSVSMESKMTGYVNEIRLCYKEIGRLQEVLKFADKAIRSMRNIIQEASDKKS